MRSTPTQSKFVPYVLLTLQVLLHSGVTAASLVEATGTSTLTLTPPQMQARMGLGINLGNRLDLYQQPAREVNESFFDAFKSKNFSNVRIPVCWDMHTATTTPYKIDDQFLQLVETVVDWSLARGFVTILNTHHEKWLDDPSVFAQKLPRLESIWDQIATRFASKDQNLLFEIFNEPHLMTVGQLNQMNAAILPIIRKNNPSRIVLLMGLQFGNPSWILNNPTALDIPSDSQLMLEIHNYDPFKYAGAHPTSHSWGSTTDRKQLEAWVSSIQSWSESNNLPIYYGEFGCTNSQSAATGRDDWYKAHASAVYNLGWGGSVWSDGGGHLIFDYNTGDWVDAIVADLGKIVQK